MMADRQYQLAPGVYVNAADDGREYQIAPETYLNEEEGGSPPAGGNPGIIGGGVGSGMILGA